MVLELAPKMFWNCFHNCFGTGSKMVLELVPNQVLELFPLLFRNGFQNGSGTGSKIGSGTVP